MKKTPTLLNLAEQIDQNVEDIFAHYVSVITTLPENLQPVITRRYLIQAPKYQDIVLHLPITSKTARYLDDINKKVNRLTKTERKIMITRYMDLKAKRTDKEVCRVLQMNERQYQSIRIETIFKLGLSLDVID
jgi:diphthamide synthase subunit DPH2